MIEPKEIYGHQGYLVRTADVPDTETLFGIFVYHDIGAIKPYPPWNKLRIVSVIFNKRLKQWQFKMMTLRGKQKVWHRAHEWIGIRMEFLDEVVQVINKVYAELKGLPIPTEKELMKIGLENYAAVEERKAESEEDRLLKELEGTR